MELSEICIGTPKSFITHYHTLNQLGMDNSARRLEEDNFIVKSIVQNRIKINNPCNRSIILMKMPKNDFQKQKSSMFLKNKNDVLRGSVSNV